MYRQGDALDELTQLPVAGPDGTPRQFDAPLGAVLISQTCDVVLPNRLAVQLAPRVRLTGTAAAEARAGKRLRYVPYPLSATTFADLDVVATVAKAVVADQPRQAGAVADDDVRRLARAVARKFGRFPFPDLVTPWLTPLEDVMKSKAARPASPEGQALEDVVQFRVEAAGGWCRRTTSRWWSSSPPGRCRRSPTRTSPTFPPTLLLAPRPRRPAGPSGD